MCSEIFEVSCPNIPGTRYNQECDTSGLSIRYLSHKELLRKPHKKRSYSEGTKTSHVVLAYILYYVYIYIYIYVARIKLVTSDSVN